MTQVATIVTADTILRWRRELSGRNTTYPTRRPGRPRVDTEIRGLVIRMATENPSWGYTRMQGALKNLGHRVARSTVANILKEEGIPPSGQRPMSWRTFLRAHWAAMPSANVFTAAGWTLRLWVTQSAVFAIERCSRRVRVMASTPHAHERVVRQVADVVDVEPAGSPWRTGDQHLMWSMAVQHRLQAAGVRHIRAPVFVPNRDAHAPFVSSIQDECVNRLVSHEGYDRRTVAPFVTPDDPERNYLDHGNELIFRFRCQHSHAPIRRQRIGSLANHHCRAA